MLNPSQVYYCQDCSWIGTPDQMADDGPSSLWCCPLCGASFADNHDEHPAAGLFSQASRDFLPAVVSQKRKASLNI